MLLKSNYAIIARYYYWIFLWYFGHTHYHYCYGLHVWCNIELHYVCIWKKIKLKQLYELLVSIQWFYIIEEIAALHTFLYIFFLLLFLSPFLASWALLLYSSAVNFFLTFDFIPTCFCFFSTVIKRVSISLSLLALTCNLILLLSSESAKKDFWMMGNNIGN